MADESQYRLRIPADLKAKLEAAARESGRSMNAQVLYTLQVALDQEDEVQILQRDRDEHEKRIADLERRMDDVFHMSGWRDYPENDRG